jgi:hypothetical protein
MQMTEERQVVAWAVLQGKLPANELTYAEIKEIDNLIFDAVSVKLSSPLLCTKMH